jgi:hypothetical protein
MKNASAAAAVERVVVDEQTEIRKRKLDQIDSHLLEENHDNDGCDQSDHRDSVTDLVQRLQAMYVSLNTKQTYEKN